MCECWLTLWRVGALNLGYVRVVAGTFGRVGLGAARRVPRYGGVVRI